MHGFGKKKTKMAKSVEFVNKGMFGLEVDYDVMENFPSSAKSPSGFTIQETRDFIRCIS